MSTVTKSSLSDFSDQLTALVDRVATGVVAVKVAPHRVVSGVVLHDDLIAVADHALRREERVAVRTSDGTETSAVVLGRDPSVDIAILKAEALKAKSIEAADPSSFKPGMLAVVVGMTIDVGATASLGLVGATGGPRRTWRGGTLDHFLRLDVGVYPSQTGAAVVNTEGRLIGLATPGLLRHSSVAVPVKTIQRIAAELLKEGRIRHGYLGVGLQPVAVPVSLQAKLSHPQDFGLILLSVEPESPAEQAGFQIGDILLTLAGRALTEVDELQTALRGDAVGKSVEVVLLRGGEVVKANAVISERGRKRV